jgi:hypothetical protein
MRLLCSVWRQARIGGDPMKTADRAADSCRVRPAASRARLLPVLATADLPWRQGDLTHHVVCCEFWLWSIQEDTHLENPVLALLVAHGLS